MQTAKRVEFDVHKQQLTITVEIIRRRSQLPQANFKTNLKEKPIAALHVLIHTEQKIIRIITQNILIHIADRLCYRNSERMRTQTNK